MKILIELPTWLGDAVMTTPAIENIENYFSKVEITLVGSFVALEALRNHPKVVAIYVIDKRLKSLYLFAKKAGEFDLFISFRNSARSTILKFFVSSKDKFQFDEKRYKNRHQVEKYNDFISESLNTNFLPGKLNIYPNLELVKSSKKPTVGINPGASYGDSKRWNTKKFAQVAAELSSNYEILIFGGEDETDIAAEIVSLLVEMGINNFTNLAGKTSIQELIDRISSLDLFITGDSGPMHIAASFKVPTVSIFGPTRDDETSQWMNASSIIVKKRLDCQPCMKRICPLRHNNCMNLIEAKDIHKAIKSLN
jgi:heptosyltransferase II